MIIDYSEIFYYARTISTVISSLVLFKYFIYLSIAPFYSVHKQLLKIQTLRAIKNKKTTEKYYPLVSILVPAWNEEVGVITTIMSALSNTYNNIEIIVINDGSTDNTDLVMKDFIKKYNPADYGGKKVYYFKQPNGGKGVALNTGIKKAKGEIVISMDADSAHNKNTIKNLVKYFHNPTVQALVGNVKVTNTKTLTGMIQHFEYVFGFYFKRVHSIFDAEYIFGGACAAFRKSTTFDKFGGFDIVNKTEDIEYSMRLKANGIKSVYAEDVVAYTEGASDLKGLYKQRLRWKKGRIDTFIRYKSLFFSFKNHHSYFLSWVVLPYALLGEMQTLLEPVFFTGIWVYTFLTGDYLSAGISSIFIFFTYISAFLLGDRESKKYYFFYFPFTWLMFYILVGVEFFALLKSIEMIKNNKEIVWQSWQRKGIADTIKLKTI